MRWRLGMADGWRQLHKRGTVIVSGSLALVTAFGPAIVDAWNSMPPDLKVLLPQGIQRYAALAAFCLILVVRYLAVRKKGSDDASA